MKRSPMPKARKPMQRSGRVKPANRKRKASEFARCYGSKERVEWVKAQPCAVSSAGCEVGPSENAHTKGDGASRKAAYDKIVPLCRLHHRALHNKGVDWFRRTYFVNLDRLADNTEQLWLASRSPRRP